MRLYENDQCEKNANKTKSRGRKAGQKDEGESGREQQKRNISVNPPIAKIIRIPCQAYFFPLRSIAKS